MTVAVAAFCLGAMMLLPACKQGDGDRCEVDNDCQTGLVCENPQGTSGHCMSPQTVSPIADAAAPDAPPPRLDASVDAPRDLAVPDTRVPDGSEPADAAGGDAVHLDGTTGG